MTVKTHYSAQELAGLPGMPGTDRNVRLKAEREGWQARRRVGAKGMEYAVHVLPTETQAAIRNQAAKQMLAQAEVLPVAETARDRAVRVYEEQLDIRLAPVNSLTDAQREVAEARCAIVAEVMKVARVLGKKKATVHVAEAAASQTLPEVLQALVVRANAKGNGARTVCSRTLFNWMRAFESTTSPSERLRRLAPQVPQPVMAMPDWMGDFMCFWRRPNKPPVAEAYRDFLKAATRDQVPSIYAVRRALDKLPPTMLYIGRHTGAALTAKLPYVRRDWSQLYPGDVWIGDGHSFKAKVMNPDTGVPFKPEVTLVIDGASRMVMGWSVALSENVIAVSDAMRHGVSRYPLPLMYYSDNGAGETGKVLDAPVTGMLPRLGIHHETGIPGNPQGRGIIERIWQTITLPLARHYATYHGKGVDNDTLRKVDGEIRRALTVARRGEVSVIIPHVPTLEEFLRDLEAAVTDYNTLHSHSELPRLRGRHMTPSEYYEAHRDRESESLLTPMELQDLFRPTFVRTAARGQIQLWNNVYFSQELMLVDGEQVQVGVDIHDAASVVIRNMDGRFVCMAHFEQNRRAAFPTTLTAKLRDDRIKGQVKRAEDKIALAESARSPALVLERMEQGLDLNADMLARAAAELAALPVDGSAESSPSRAAGMGLVPELPAQPAPTASWATPEQKYARWLALDLRMANGEDLGERDKDFWELFQRSDLFALLKERFQGDADLLEQVRG